MGKATKQTLWTRAEAASLGKIRAYTRDNEATDQADDPAWQEFLSSDDIYILCVKDILEILKTKKKSEEKLTKDAYAQMGVTMGGEPESIPDGAEAISFFKEVYKNVKPTDDPDSKDEFLNHVFKYSAYRHDSYERVPEDPDIHFAASKETLVRFGVIPRPK